MLTRTCVLKVEVAGCNFALLQYLRAYRPPLNFRLQKNPYVFYLFKQSTPNMVVSDARRDEIKAGDFNAFRMPIFITENGLIGLHECLRVTLLRSLCTFQCNLRFRTYCCQRVRCVD